MHGREWTAAAVHKDEWVGSLPWLYQDTGFALVYDDRITCHPNSDTE